MKGSFFHGQWASLKEKRDPILIRKPFDRKAIEITRFLLNYTKLTDREHPGDPVPDRNPKIT